MCHEPVNSEGKITPYNLQVQSSSVWIHSLTVKVTSYAGSAGFLQKSLYTVLHPLIDPIFINDQRCMKFFVFHILFQTFSTIGDERRNFTLNGQVVSILQIAIDISCDGIWLSTCEAGNRRDAGAIFIHKVASSIEDPAMVQRHEGMSGSGGVVFPILTVCILQRRELVFTQHFVYHKLFGKLEDVKDKLLHLDAIRFVWLDQLPTGDVHVRNLLLSHVVLQLRFVNAGRARKRSQNLLVRRHVLAVTVLQSFWPRSIWE